MKIILKGERGVGKSTLLQSLLKELRDYDGFATEKIDEIESAKVYIRPLKEPLDTKKHKSVAIIKGPHDIRIDSQAFDDFAVQHLNHIKPKWYIFDELGFLEKDTHSFKPFIRSCFQSDHHMIAVVKSYKSNIVDDLMNDIDYNIFEITNENRASVLKSIQILIRNHIFK